MYYPRRIDNANNVRIDFRETRAVLQQYDGGVFTLFGNNGAATSTCNQEYDVTVIADGKHIEVWRAEAGGDQELILETDGVTVLDSTTVLFASGTNTYAIADDIVYETANAETVIYAHNGANELMDMVEGRELTAYTYDDWGRTVTKSRAVDPSTTHVASYSYGYGDKLRNYTTNFPGESSLAYNYDGLGKRRNKLVGGTDATWWRWAGWSIVSDYDGGTVQTDWDPGTRQLGYIPGLAQFTGDSGAGYDYAFYLQDHLGSTRGILDESKAVLAKYSYLPYGQLNIGGGLPLNVGFTGHHWDAETGMYFAPFRYYMPGAGRWLSRDPLGFLDGPNTYAYVRGRSTNYNDPSGTSGVGKLVKICADGLAKPIGRWLTKKEIRQLISEGEDVMVGTMRNANEVIEEATGHPAIFDFPTADTHTMHGHTYDRNGAHVFVGPPGRKAPGIIGGIGVGLQDAGVITEKLTAEYWTKDIPVLDWIGWAVDLVNPFSLPQDIVDIGGIGVDIASAVCE